MKRVTRATIGIAIPFLMLCIIPFSILKVKAEQYSPLSYAGNYCLDCDGDFVNCGYSMIFRADKLTIEAWIKPKHDIEGGSDSVYGHMYGCVAHRRPGWFFGFVYTTGQMTFIIDSIEFRSGKSFWNKDNWYHIAVTYNSTLTSNNVRFYVNGTLESQHDSHDSIVYGDGPLQIGKQEGGPEGGHPLAGFIDEVRYWNVSRTGVEILDAWNRTLNDTTETTNPNLVGYWRFDEGNGTHSEDYSIYNNTATFAPSPSTPEWVYPGSPIVSEFSWIPATLILAIATSIIIISMQHRLRKQIV